MVSSHSTYYVYAGSIFNLLNILKQTSLLLTYKFLSMLIYSRVSNVSLSYLCSSERFWGFFHLLSSYVTSREPLQPQPFPPPEFGAGFLSLVVDLIL